ncbi:MAG: hypothetical protein BGP06_18905 [Rhizobiales bacterium 65-9]|nr:MAG: hypothetical protein BGP06_18905 [Rhizobiales bacterium 65-9]
MRTVSAAEANRQFSALLRAATQGETIIVTSRGKPVAEIRPVDAKASAENERRREALGALFARLDSQPALNLGRASRDEMYD